MFHLFIIIILIRKNIVPSANANIFCFPFFYFAKDDTVGDNREGLAALQGWLGVKRDADGCYVRWPLCIQAKRAELDGRGGERGLGVGVGVGV